MLDLPINVKQVLCTFIDKQKEVFGDTLVKIILYGSYARGDYTEDSDVDVMVLTTEEDEEAFARLFADMSGDTYDYFIDSKVDLSPNLQNINIYNKWLGKYPYYDNIEREGVILYDRLQ